MKPSSNPWIAFVSLLFFCVGFALPFPSIPTSLSGWGNQCRADAMALRTAMAKAVRDAAGEVLPSLVTIEIISVSDVTSQNDQSEVEKDAPTCGVIVDGRGYVIASDIVLRRASASILVVLSDGSRHAAEVIARDFHRDLVLLKIKTDKPLSPISLPDQMKTPIGSTVVAAGRYGIDQAPMVSSGILSAVERLDGIALQTDARVSPSFYGGVLVDLYGSPIGVLVPAVAEGGAPDDTSWYDSGIAFAIPTDILKKKLPRLIDGQDVKKGLMGIVPKTSDPYQDGTELATVRTRSPAELAGLKSGDTILSLDGQNVKRFQEIRQVLGRFDAGEEIEVSYRRKKETKKVKVVLADTIPPLQPQRIGILAGESNVEPEKADSKDGDSKDSEGDEKDQPAESVTRVLVDAVIPGSGADGKLKPGDEIRSQDGVEIDDLDTLRRRLMTAEPGKPMKLSLKRDGKVVDVSVKVSDIGGPIPDETVPDWTVDKDAPDSWEVTELKLPDAPNNAAVVSPGEDEKGDYDRLGLLILLLSPGQGEPKEILESWTEFAPRHGVIVCVVAPGNPDRWQQQEVDIVERMATTLIKRNPIATTAVAIATSGSLEGGKATAADAMALAVSMSASRTFFGVSVSEKARPPAVRLRENEPDQSLQILLPIEGEDELPTWGTALAQAGYPIVYGGKTDGEILLQWVRLLQTL